MSDLLFNSAPAVAPAQCDHESLFASHKVTLKGNDAARTFTETMAADSAVTYMGLFPRRDPRSEEKFIRSRRVTGTFDQCLPTLTKWQAEGRNIYMRVNEGGSTKESIVRIRAISIEFDAPDGHHARSQSLPSDWHHFPSLIVRRGSSVHAHWLVSDCPVEKADQLQRRIQQHYGSDPYAVGRQRIWRVPGFPHPEFPSQDVDLYVSSEAARGQTYTVAELESGLTIAAPEPAAKTSSECEPAEILTAAFRSVLSFIDPTFSNDYDRWAGFARVIRSGQLPIADPGNYDGEGILDDWCSGELWRARTGEQNFVVPTYHGLEHLLNEISANARDGGNAITLGSFMWEARKNGYGQLLDSTEHHNAVPAPEFTINTKTRRPHKTFENAFTAAMHMPATPERDDFNHRVVFRGSTLPWPETCGRTLDDGVLRTIRYFFLKAYDLDVTKDHVSESVQTVADFYRFHPVRDYLEGLQWDGRARIDTWLSDICGAADSSYVRAVGRKFLVAAVARVMNPGCKFDFVLTLEGLQGAGKSTVARILASDDFFTDNIPGDLGKADAVQCLQGRWIVELSELDSIRKSEMSTVKAFLSRTSDRARFAYERLPADYPRQCVFIATTNENAFLRDTTGNRRFWPVSVGEIELNDLRANRDQLWAEAVEAYRAGETLTIPEDLWAEAAAQQEERHAHDPWEETLRNFVDGLTTPTSQRVDRVHSSTLLSDALDVHASQQRPDHFSRVKNLMTQRLGWRYRPSLRIGERVNSGYERVSTL